MGPTPTSRWISRPAARQWRCSPPSTAARAYHASLPGYAVTPLVEVPSLARRWGVGAVLVKNESRRFGLPAFKALGASWAVARLFGERAGLRVADLRLNQLRVLAHEAPMTLVTATDGNHGRALARVGSWLEVPVEVVVPDVMSARTAAAIAAEGAQRHADRRLLRRRRRGRRAAGRPAAVGGAGPGHGLGRLRGRARLDRRGLPDDAVRAGRPAGRPRPGRRRT